ncbi:hypothetical protein AK812_SmicGene28118 [Symbiodinium microadriaticum]|uniref:Uncharacterized protein n=1 Tax=Symbiodinium microadriaticum TaxID=2951 RepID=A0A1Q9D545_SYMMI|nr:hypothetical protein AK812_SmicGene28118 [Symbiodinium microadriaticum]
MTTAFGLLIVAAPQYIVSAGIGGASSAGLVAGSFGLGLVFANLVAFKLASVLHPWLMCIVAASTGLMGVVLGGVLTAPQLRLHGLTGAAGLVGFAQSLHVVARTFYQAEEVGDGQAFVSGWVSASNIVGIAAAAFVTSFVDCTVYTNLGFLCGGGFLLYAGLILLLTCSSALQGRRLRRMQKLHQESAESKASTPKGAEDLEAAISTQGTSQVLPPPTLPAVPTSSLNSSRFSWISWQFAKVCFLIFTMAIAREAQKFLIPLIGAENEISTSFVGNVAFMSQMESLVAAPLGGWMMECLGILPLVLVSVLLSAVGIQVLCMPGMGFYVQGASLLGLACGLSAGAAIALSILHAPKERSKSFMNGCRFFNSSADVVIPLVVGSLASSSGVLVAGSTLTLSMLASVCIALFSFELQLILPDFRKDVRVPSMDFVIPLKAMGPFTRTVLEGIFSHYAPRQIYIVCRQEARKAVSEVMMEWSVPRGKISFVDEESYFQKTFNFSREDLKQAWKGTKSPRDFGWWWQQLLKLGAGQCIEGISENFCVWDADLIVLEPWPLTDPSSTQCYVAPLQEKYLSDKHQEAYDSSTRHILKMEPTQPRKGGTWIAHHMVFNKGVLCQMLDLIETNVGSECAEPWPLKILGIAEGFERVSEYVLYGTYASQSVLRAHPYQAYGARGLRLYGREEALAKGRDCNEFLIQRLNAESKPLTGYSYQRVAGEVAPLHLTHLQMEHV